MLVTGASSGLGARTAELLASQGYRVAGAARRTDRIAGLPHVLPIALDLSDAASIETAVDATVAELGGIDVLVNSAGYGQFGSIEETTIERARHQFEVNVFGQVRLTQLVAAQMRAASSGRIVTISSLAGEFSSPLGGWYHASKYALEAISDSLRLELGAFGVQVVVVQPGPVRTSWHDDALKQLRSISGAGAYGAMAESVGAYHSSALDTAIASEVDDVAQVIVTAATTAAPRTRYRVGRGAGAAVAMSRLPDRIFDAMIRRQFGLR